MKNFIKRNKKKIMLGVGLGIGAASIVYGCNKLLGQRDAFKLLYENECEYYVSLARICGIAQSGDHTSIAKTVFKDGTEFIYEQVK